MAPAVFPGDPSLFDVAMALVLLVVVPVFVLIVLATVAVYIRRDAEEYLEELEERGELEAPEEPTDLEGGSPDQGTDGHEPGASGRDGGT